MNMLRPLLAGLAFCTLSLSWGQHALLTDYDWDPAPTLPDTNRMKGATDVLMKRNILAQYDDSGETLDYFKVFHVQRYLANAASVEGSQTIELGVDHVSEVITMKARSVGPDGVVRELKQEDFRRRKDEREESSELYFAFEGLQPGSMVEYLMLTKERSSYNGNVIRLQFGVPVWEQRYELIVPETWRFVFKGHNGVPTPAVDSSHAGVLRHHVLLEDMKAFETERSSYPDVYRAYLVQKLDAVPDQNLVDLSGYTSVVRNYHKAVYPDVSSKTKKALAGTLKKMKLSFARDEDDRVRTIDDHIRRNFGTVGNGGPEYADLDHMLSSGNCSEFGITKLYANLFREAGIEHQMVLTTDRSEAPFDPEFEAHNYLNTVLFYFPGSKKYLEPTEQELGLGYPAALHTATYGLFIRNVEVGGVFGGVGSVKPIASLPAEATRHDLDINVSFNTDASEATVKLRNELSGYYASFTQNFYTYLNEEDRAKLLRGNLEYLYEGATSTDFTADNTGVMLFGVKPFVIEGTAVTPMFTDPAGDDVLFRVGDLIGPQMEMYVEKPRQLPVDEDYNRYYDRRITVQLPAGWNCTDLSPMDIHKVLEIDGKVQAEFKSTATEKDGVISVEVIEYYRQQHVPLEHFEAWRSVINAAADFNKRALVLTKG
jgi:hypothetical protein